MSRIPTWSRPILAGAIALAITGLLYLTAVGASLQDPFDVTLSNILYHSLGKSGVPVVHHQKTIVAPTMRMEIVGHRNGLFLVAFAVAIVAVWPSTWKKSAVWLVPLLLIAVTANFVRLFSVFIYGVNHGRRSAESFDFWLVLAILSIAVGVEVWKLSTVQEQASKIA